MMNNTFHNTKEFYPTPDSLLEKVFEGVDWRRIGTVLEPSAGKGNICDYIMKVSSEYPYYNSSIRIDCIEVDSDLQKVLEGKEYRIVHNNFLTFQTFKQYDLIVMNPPFSNGCTHLLKALELSKNGGNVICILNAETIKNPYCNERKALVQKLEELNATIDYYQEEFTHAERKTSVEVAVIKVAIAEKEFDSTIYNELKKKRYGEGQTDYEQTSVAVADYIKAAVMQYNLEVEAGISLIREYRAMAPLIMSDLRQDSFKQPILSLKNGNSDATINGFVEDVRMKYWNALFRDKRFTGKMTGEQYQQFISQVDKLKDYDFSYFNILSMQEKMSKTLISSIEDCIVALFDELSHQYAYNNSEYEKNVHYYNGWCTNKSWYINKKVILPFYDAFSRWDGEYQPTDYKVMQKLSDIEKALNYLDGGLSDGVSLENALGWAKRTGTTKKIPLKYFNVTFYKKGTIHIEFTNEELLKKLNIFGSQQKKWLPPAYGKKTYAEMDEQERAVVDEFEGEISYRKTMENADYYIYNPENSIKMLEVS